MKRYSYFAFGMQIHSQLALPELPPGDGPADLTITLDEDYDEWRKVYPHSRWYRADRDGAVLFVEGVGGFWLDSGCRVRVSPDPQARESLLRLYLLGTVMGMLAYQRGLLSLHGSVVGVNGCPVAILAASGGGKSTLAAALLAGGACLLADDLAAVEWIGGRACVLPGFPQMKIDPAAAAALGVPLATLHPLDPEEPKLAWRTLPAPSARPVPLERVFILDEGETQPFAPLSPGEAVIELVRHSCPPRLLFPADALHLQQCGRLAREVPILRLQRPAGLSALPALAAQIEAALLDAPPLPSFDREATVLASFT